MFKIKTKNIETIIDVYAIVLFLYCLFYIQLCTPAPSIFCHILMLKWFFCDSYGKQFSYTRLCNKIFVINYFQFYFYTCMVELLHGYRYFRAPLQFFP